jgi:hypothetical protein
MNAESLTNYLHQSPLYYATIRCMYNAHAPVRRNAKRYLAIGSDMHLAPTCTMHRGVYVHRAPPPFREVHVSLGSGVGYVHQITGASISFATSPRSPS